MAKVKYGPENPDITYLPHKHEEHLFNTGEIMMNYVEVGTSDKPALLLIGGQQASWWVYEHVLEPLTQHFQVYAIDLHGLGRSTRTPERYTLDNIGDDLVRFIAYAIKRPVVVSGHSSGGVIAAWLSAYALPGMIRGAFYQDPPLFSLEQAPPVGPSMPQTSSAKLLGLYSKYLGDQWSVGDWEGLIGTLREVLPEHIFNAFIRNPEEPGQNFKEYDPEWARACMTGSFTASCNHAQMLSQVKCPVLFTYHDYTSDKRNPEWERIGMLEQIKLVEKLIKDTGQPITVLSFPDLGHSMHFQKPELFISTIVDWEKTLPSEEEVKQNGVFSS